MNFAGRIRPATRKRARLFAAAHEIDIQDLLDAALDEYMKRRGG